MKLYTIPAGETLFVALQELVSEEVNRYAVHGPAELVAPESSFMLLAGVLATPVDDLLSQAPLGERPTEVVRDFVKQVAALIRTASDAGVSRFEIQGILVAHGISMHNALRKTRNA